MSPSRRGFLAGATGVATGIGGALGLARPLPAEASVTLPAGVRNRDALRSVEPFWGPHQGGILTPSQRHTYFAAFDLVASSRDAVAQMLQRWTAAAARMSEGKTAAPLANAPQAPAPDAGDTIGMPACRLTLTFGFGAGLFVKDGKDRYGLASHRPAALVDMPVFPGDQLIAAKTGGDLSVQASADDAQVAFHAVRELAGLAYDVAQIRWVQTGFVSNPPNAGATQAKGAEPSPRNLMGFKDGTNNPDTGNAQAMNEIVWVGDEGPGWMRGGSYLVVRRSRIALEHWDRMNVAFQEQTVGRHKYSGAPLGGKDEFDLADLTRNDRDGNPVIPENAHIRLAAASTNGGARILRRSYSYNDGVNFIAERWPPWRQAMEFDAGLLFICYQRDPRTGFIKIFEKLARFDMMNQFVTVNGSGLFACPPGARQGGYVGQALFAGA